MTWLWLWLWVGVGWACGGAGVGAPWVVLPDGTWMAGSTGLQALETRAHVQILTLGSVERGITEEGAWALVSYELVWAGARSTGERWSWWAPSGRLVAEIWLPRASATGS